MIYPCPPPQPSPHGGGGRLVVLRAFVPAPALRSKIVFSLFVLKAKAGITTERFPPPWGRVGASLEKGGRLFQGNPGWGQQINRTASIYTYTLALMVYVNRQYLARKFANCLFRFYPIMVRQGAPYNFLSHVQLPPTNY